MSEKEQLKSKQLCRCFKCAVSARCLLLFALIEGLCALFDTISDVTQRFPSMKTLCESVMLWLGFLTPDFVVPCLTTQVTMLF